MKLNLIDRNAINLEKLYKNKKLDNDIFIFYPKLKKLSKKDKLKLLKYKRPKLMSKKKLR
tara:strand:- start:1002 stop:1181 length:180 start_codon:yes stop_codon:yes gene_type:complete